MKKALTVPLRWLENWRAHGLSDESALEYIASHNGIPGDAQAEIAPAAHVVFKYTWGVDSQSGE